MKCRDLRIESACKQSRLKCAKSLVSTLYQLLRTCLLFDKTLSLVGRGAGQFAWNLSKTLLYWMEIFFTTTDCRCRLVHTVRSNRGGKEQLPSGFLNEKKTQKLKETLKATPAKRLSEFGLSGRKIRTEPRDDEDTTKPVDRLPPRESRVFITGFWLWVFQL